MAPNGYFDSNGNWVYPEQDNSAPADNSVTYGDWRSDPRGAHYGSATPKAGGLEEIYKSQVAAGERDEADLGGAAIIDRDSDGWEKWLREKAAENNIQYHPSDVADVIRQVSYARNIGVDPMQHLLAAEQKYKERATNSTSGGSSNDSPVAGLPSSYGSGYPTPSRTNMTRPVAPPTYSSSFTPGNLTYTPVGQEQRNNIAMSILNNPESMGQDVQDQMFEQQKELASSLANQRKSQLGQSTTSRGLTAGGGAQQKGEADIDFQMASDLLKGKRDISAQAAIQNRADKHAAVSMQQALQAGDLDTVISIFEANQSQKEKNEQFLQAAAQMNAANQLQMNAQNLAADIATKDEVMDFFRFLEAQRQFENDLNYRYYATNLGA